LLAALLGCSLGCAGNSVVSRRLPSPVSSHEKQTLDPALLASARVTSDQQAYEVGAGDSILVAVYGHPELSIAQYSGAASMSGRPAGLVVDNDGTIQLPLIGSIHVAGKTAEQMRALLEKQLALYVKEPRVTVQVVFNGSIRYYLLGQFTSPGLKYSDRPLHLMEALSLGGSVQLERASLRGAYVARGGRRLPINFRRLLREGDLSQNISLRSGDMVFVPDNTGEQAFVFGGAVQSNPRGGAVPFVNGQLNLLQALAQAGFGYRERAQGRLSKTIVIRSEGDSGEIFVVDAKKILNGDAAPFELAPGDIVYVPTKAFTKWNQALEQLLPTLQTISGLLTPFVQIKYLEKN
jgi:polysaccharide export outer membrane protein